MSYMLTEAERKHFAAVEDTKMYLVKNPVEGATDSVTLKIEDSDKLNLDVTLPSYKFAVTDEDDKYSRIRLVSDDGNEIICEGVEGYDNPTKENRGLGIGWRYTISFTKDEDGYVNAIKLVRKNDGATKVLSFNRLSKLTIKELTVDNESTFKDNVTISKSHEEDKEILDEEGNVIDTETVTVQDDITLDVKGLVKADKAEIASAKVADLEANDATVKNATITERLVIGEASTEDEEVEKNAEVIVNNTVATVSESTIKTDETTDVLLAKAEISEAAIKNEKVVASEIEDALIVKADISKVDIQNARIKRTDADEIFSNHEHTVQLCVKDKTDEEGNVVARALADIDTEKVRDSVIENLEVAKASVNDLSLKNLEAVKATIEEEVVQKSAITEATVESLDAEKISAGDIEVANSITNGFGNIVNSTDETLEIGNNEEEMVVVSKGHGDLNDDNHYHIKALIDGKETFLMTADDAKELGLDNIVDRTSNQNIRGQKKFYDKLSIGSGILGIEKIDDDKEAFFNVIVRGPDANHPGSVSPWTPNPELDEAADEGKAYEEARALYNEFTNATRNGNINLAKYYKTLDKLNANKDALANEKAYNGQISILSSQLKDGLDAADTGYAEALEAAEKKYDGAIDAYNAHQGYTEESDLFLKKDDDNNYPNERVDEIYADAELAALRNDNATAWLKRVDGVLSNNNIAAVVDAISRLGLDMFLDKSYKNIKTVEDFFYYGDRWLASGNAAISVFDTFIKATSKDPSLKNCADYDAYSTKEGIYKSGDLSYQLVVKAPFVGNVSLHIDGYSFDVDNDTQIFDFVNGNENTNPITTYAQLSEAYKNAKNSEYMIEKVVVDLKEAKDDYLALLGMGVVGVISVSMTKPSDELDAKAFGKVTSGFNIEVVENIASKNYSIVDAKIASNVASTNKSVSDEAIAELETIIAELEATLAEAKTDSTSGITVYNEKATAYLANEYVSTSCPQKKEFVAAEFDALTAERKTLDGAAVTAPVKTERVERLIAGNIEANIPNPDAQTVINIGNPHDAIAFEAAAFEYFPEGADTSDETQKIIDEHMLAVVNGHLHKIAYVDEITTADNSALDGATLKFSVKGDEEKNEATISKAKVIKSIFTEAEMIAGKGTPEVIGSDEEIFKIRGEDGVEVRTEGSDIVISADAVAPKVEIDTASVANGIKLTIGKEDVEIASGKGTLNIDGNSDKEVNIDVNTFTGNDYKSTDIISAYDNLSETEGNSNLIAKAVDVKAMTDKVEQIAIDARSALDVRVPAAPRQTGSYVLNASVFADAPDADGNVKMTSKYHWNGAMALPETSNELGALDDMGLPLIVSTEENPVEYGLKLRLVEETITYDDGSTQKKVVPTLCWSRIR